MFNLNSWKSGTAAIMAVSVTAGAVAPLMVATPSLAQTRFSDVSSNYWAAPFIEQLSQRGVIAGFPDGTFRPNEPVTRAQFASMVTSAFSRTPQRQPITFIDVPNNFWASNVIRQAYTTGFLSGFPGNRFEPNQVIPRQQVLVALANGLNYSPTANTQTTLQAFNDSFNIADWARSPIAAATERGIVVNHPNINLLNPTGTATRAQVAASIYQALVSAGQASAINSPFIVAARPGTTPPVSVTIPQGTRIPIRYDQAEKILVTKDETAPLTLTVDQNVVTQDGTVVIPAGSRVIGKLQPAQGGSQFVAEKLVLTTGQEYQINATSEVITKTETIRRGTNTSTIIRNTILGGGAAAAVAAVTGDRSVATEEVLGGAAIGGLIGLFFGRNSVDLISIAPNTDLQMTINQQFLVSVR
jgi:hypothetical protein